MAKVNLELMRVLHNFAKDLEGIGLRIRTSVDSLGAFCQDCGETDPLSGFYPMRIGSSDSLSDLLCNACEQARRDRAKQSSQEGGTNE